MILPKKTAIRPFRTVGFSFNDLALGCEVMNPAEMLPDQERVEGFTKPNLVTDTIWATEFVVYEKVLDSASLTRMAQHECQDYAARGIPHDPADVLQRFKEYAMLHAIPTRKATTVLFNDDGIVAVLARGGKADRVEDFIRKGTSKEKRLVNLYNEVRSNNQDEPTPYFIQWCWDALEQGSYKMVGDFALGLLSPVKMDGVTAKVSCSGMDALSVAGSLPSGFQPVDLTLEVQDGNAYHLTDGGIDSLSLGVTTKFWRKADDDVRFSLFMDGVKEAVSVFEAIYRAAQGR